MGVINNINRVLNAKSTGIFLFGFTGTYKMISDYKKAPEGEKKETLMRDAIILGGSAIGLTAYTQGRKNFLVSPFKQKCNKIFDNSVARLKQTSLWKKLNTQTGKLIKKPAGVILKNGYNIAKDCADYTLLYASGLLGAIGADYILQVGHTHQNLIDIKNKEEEKKSMEASNDLDDPVEKIKEKFKDNKIDNYINKVVDKDTKQNILSNITNMPEMSVLTNTMIGLEGLRITEEKTFKDKLNRTTNSLLKNTIVPMFFLSLTSNLTKNMKGIYRVPLVFSSLVAGSMYTNKLIDKKMNKQIDA